MVIMNISTRETNQAFVVVEQQKQRLTVYHQHIQYSKNTFNM